MYFQNYNPFGNAFLSTLVAVVPIGTLLYFIAVHPHRDADGVRRFGISAPYAAFYGVLAAFVVSCLAFRMPLPAAISAFSFGTLSGLLGIVWIVVSAMLLYTMTVITGQFEIVKESIIHIWASLRSSRPCSTCWPIPPRSPGVPSAPPSSPWPR